MDVGHRNNMCTYFNPVCTMRAHQKWCALSSYPFDLTLFVTERGRLARLSCVVPARRIMKRSLHGTSHTHSSERSLHERGAWTTPSLTWSCSKPLPVKWNDPCMACADCKMERSLHGGSQMLFGTILAAILHASVSKLQLQFPAVKWNDPRTDSDFE